MKQKLLLVTVALLCAVGSWAYTGSAPTVGKTYFLYNTGVNKYWVGTSGSYGTTANIADATPVTVEDGGKLAFTYNGTTYRIYHSAGSAQCNNTTGVSFTFESVSGGYKLKSKNPSDEHDRDMGSDGSFPQRGKSPSNVTWQFISCDEVAETHYVTSANGWEKVASVSALQTNPQDYFFAIFSANAPGLILDATTSNTSNPYKPHYKTATDPLSSSQYLFEMDICGDGLALKSTAIDKYFANNAYPWDYDATKTSVDADCEISVTLADGAYTINTKYGSPNNYLGLWSPENGYKNGERLAGNKSNANKGSFLIYRIAKKNLDLTLRMSNSTDEWAVTSGTKKAYGGGVETYNGDNTQFNAEDVLTQTISNLPNGVYEVEFRAWENFADWNQSASIATGDDIAQVIANEAAYSINVVKDRGHSGDDLYTLYCSVTDGSLKYGINNKKGGGNWAVCVPGSLTFLTSSLPASLTGVDGEMNSTMAAAQTAALETYNAVDGQTPSNYAAAMDAIAAAETSVAAYAKAKTYLSSVEAVLATTNFYTPAAYASVYGTYKTAYDAGTLDDATADGLSYKVANYSGTERYDKNTANDLLIPGWTLDGNDATTTNSGFYINTWSTEDNSNGFANPFYEYWVADNSVLGAKKIVGTLSGLTANKYYKVTAKVRVRETNSSTKVSNSITMQVGSGDKVDVTAGTQISTTTRYVGQFSAIGQADGFGNLALTFDVASGSNISWLSFRDVNYSDPTPEAKAVLLSTINDANTLYNSGANVGSGVFQIPTAAGTTFSNAIATAQGVYDNASSTYEKVLSANSTLQTAITTYEGVTLNAPTGGTRYKLTLADRGTLTYQTASTEGGYGMPFKAAGDYMAQTFTFTQVSGNTYTMSFEDFDGNTRYICTRAQYGSGGTGTRGIRTFVLGEDGKTALPITIKATTTANVFNMLNTECDNKKLGSNGGDFYTDDTYTSWSIAEASQAEVTVSCKAGKYGTVIFPFTPDVSEGFVGITFYSCEDINTTTNNVLIESVDEPQANTPYIIKNANGSNFSTILTGWGTSATTEHTVGLLTGVYTDAYIPRSDASNSYYVLQTKDDVQAFYKVEDADFPGTPYKCYLTIPAATPVKAFLFPENPTAINAIEATENENTEIYNLAGQRLSKAQKGVNIINGKKVLVK